MEEKEVAKNSVKLSDAAFERLQVEMAAQRRTTGKFVSGSRTIEALFRELDLHRGAGRPSQAPNAEQVSYPAEHLDLHSALEVVLADPQEAGPMKRNLESAALEVKRRSKAANRLVG